MTSATEAPLRLAVFCPACRELLDVIELSAEELGESVVELGKEWHAGVIWAYLSQLYHEPECPGRSP